MAHIFVKNSLSELKAVLVDVNFPKYVLPDSKGDSLYLLEVGTTYPSISGSRVAPIYVNGCNGYRTLDEAVDDSVSKLMSPIDWGTLTTDVSKPYTTDIRPVGPEVSLNSNIFIDIVDDIPSAGIDLSDLQIILTTDEVEFDITSECVLKGTPFSYNIHWEPKLRLQRNYIEE